MKPTAGELKATAQRLAPYVYKTPVLSSRWLNEMAGATVFFKCENFQRTGAFKMRGATHAILKLNDAQKAKGVATHSSGNFAQAVALAAKIFGIKARIVMPRNAPEVKKAAVLGYGAEITYCAPTLVARELTLEKIVAEFGCTPLHPYNDYDVIAGQGTTVMELLEELPDIEAIFCPVGGGGLISGAALAAHYFGHGISVVGAEPFGADDAWQSFCTGKRVSQLNPNTIADGLRTSPGDKTFPIIQQYVSEIIRVRESEIIGAMRLIWERMKIIVEPSAAVPYAALLREKERFSGKKIGMIISGGNVDLKKLPF